MKQNLKFNFSLLIKLCKHFLSNHFDYRRQHKSKLLLIETNIEKSFRIWTEGNVKKLDWRLWLELLDKANVDLRD